MRILWLVGVAVVLVGCEEEARDGSDMCTCIPPIDFARIPEGTCEAPTVQYGCAEAPLEMRLPFDLPPPCFENLSDTTTGCTRPAWNLCGQSCFPIPDAGSRDSGPCACVPQIDFASINTCDAPTVQYGCADAPMESRLPFDLPPTCFQNAPDPATGCTVPTFTFCDTCFPQPDGGPRDAN